MRCWCFIHPMPLARRCRRSSDRPTRPRPRPRSSGSAGAAGRGGRRPEGRPRPLPCDRRPRRGSWPPGRWPGAARAGSVADKPPHHLGRLRKVGMRGRHHANDPTPQSAAIDTDRAIVRISNNRWPSTTACDDRPARLRWSAGRIVVKFLDARRGQQRACRRKRSISGSGSGKVPSISSGFCVAMTKNGCGNWKVSLEPR